MLAGGRRSLSRKDMESQVGHREGRFGFGIGLVKLNNSCLREFAVLRALLKTRLSGI